MEQAELVDIFTVWLTTMVNKIHTLHDKMEETYVIQKVLCVVHIKFLSIVSTIEKFVNLKTMTLDVLKVHEDHLASYVMPWMNKCYSPMPSGRQSRKKAGGEISFNLSR